MDIKSYIPRDSFSTTVKRFADAKGLSRAEIHRLCLLSKATASRIFRDSNDKGSTYVPTISIVMAVSVGLKLTAQESKELIFSAFPEIEFWEYFLSSKLTVHEANIVLYDVGLKPFGNIIE